MKKPIAQWFQGRAQRSIAVIAVHILAVAAACVLALRRSANPRHESPTGAARETAGNLDDLRPQVTAFCGDCHGTPAPAAFPKAAWHEEVKKGFDFYFDSGRNDLSPPDFDKVVAWFRSQAPDEVVIPRPAESATLAKLKFRVSNIAPAREDDPCHLAWQVSEIRWLELIAIACKTPASLPGR